MPTARADTASIASGADLWAGRDNPFPAWMTAGVGEWAQISDTAAWSALKDYSGVAVREETASVTVYAAAAGGHSGNYTDNKVQALVLSDSSPAWSTILAASDTTGTNLGDGGGSTGADIVMASDGHPTPRHTYTDIWWSPELARVMVGGEAAGQNGEGSTVDHFGFNPTTNDWDVQGTWTNRPNYRVFGSARDPATGKRWGFYNSGSPNRMYEWNPNGGSPTWTTRTLTGGTDYSTKRGAYCFDTSRAKIMHMAGGGWLTASSGSSAQQIDPSTFARTDISFNSSAGYTDFTSNSAQFVGSAVVHDPTGNAFFFYNGNTGTLTGQGAKVYKVTPNGTATWDMEVMSVTGVTPADETNKSGAYTKFFYVDRWRCLFLIVGGQSVYYLRVA